MLEATLSLPRVTITVSGNNQAELFEQLGRASEVFGEISCGCCGSKEIAFGFRMAQGYKFYEHVCMNPGCGAHLSMGQSKTEPGRLFPIRKLQADGRPSWKDGETDHQHRGWTKWRGDLTDDDLDTSTPVRVHSRQTANNHTAPAPAKPSTKPAEQGQQVMSGTELIGWLADLDARLARAGRSKDGELVEHVRAEAAKGNAPARMSDWSPGAVQAALHLAHQFEANHPELTPYARKARERARNALKATGSKWEEILKTYGLKATMLPEDLDPDTLDGIIADLAKPQTRHA